MEEKELNQVNEKQEMSIAERMSRLDEVQYRLYAIHRLRESLLEQHELKDNGMDLYIEGNELLNEDESRLWDFITGERDDY